MWSTCRQGESRHEYQAVRRDRHGGTAAKTAVIDENRVVRLRRTISLERLRGRPEIVGEIVSICRSTVDGARACADGDIEAVGLIVPGIVDPVARRGISSMLLGWRDVPFGRLVQTACELPTAVDHDVRSAARAEFRHGRGQGASDALSVTVGTGVGAAALIGGEIRTGGHGYGGEIAHVTVDPGGPRCPCGKSGCVESISSGPAIAAAYRAASGRIGDAEAVAVAAADGDPVAAAVWERAAGMLGRAIAVYAEILDPTMVILAGGVAGAGELLLDPVRRSVQTQLSLPFPPEIVQSGLAGDAGIQGAGMLARQLMGARPGPSRADKSEM